MLIPRVHAYYDQSEVIAALNVFDRDPVARFEKMFAQSLGYSHAALFSYFRRGLMANLDILGIRNKEVVMPAYTCVAVSHAIIKSGNKPVFVDTAADSFNCSWDSYAEKINSATGAVLGMHLFGTVMNEKCSSISFEKLKKTPIIHDRTLALGSWFNKENGALNGLCASYGLSLSKQLCMLEGGMFVTDDEGHANELRRFRDKNCDTAGLKFHINRSIFFLAHYLLFNTITYGLLMYLAKKSESVDRCIQYYDPETIDLPDDINVMTPKWQARIGLEQLRKLKEMNNLRIKLANEYAKGLEGLKKISFYKIKKGEYPSHFIIFCRNRDKLVGLARERGVDIGLHFDYVIPQLPAYKPYNTGEAYPNAGKLAKTAANLPFYPGMDSNIRDRIIKTVREIDALL